MGAEPRKCSLAAGERGTDEPAPTRAPATLSGPLHNRVFRNVWTAGVLSNFGTQIQTVGAAWAMLQLTSDARLIAGVQSAMSMPIMLFAILAGAIADLFDKRKVALLGLSLGLTSASTLALLCWQGLATPALILLLVFLCALGTTFYSPAWQSSVREQVSRADFPAAVSLNSISFNLGRSAGPAVGGVIVAAVGAGAAFAANAMSFIPLMVALLLWRRTPRPVSGQRESVGRAVSLGIMFVINAPTIRIILARILVNGLGGGAILALLPLITRYRLDGSASVYGLLFGAFGVGAVLGAILAPAIQRRMGAESTVRLAALFLGGTLLIVALSSFVQLSAAALVLAGACWTISSATFSVSVQLAAPGWVAGRALAVYQAMISAGTALSALLWGAVAGAIGPAGALAGAGVYLILVQALGLRAPLPPISDADDGPPTDWPVPEICAPIHPRSGPVSIIVTYRIAMADAPHFRELMTHVRLSRKRNGASGWTLGRDVYDTELWIECYRFATWQDYLRYRNRPTIAERRIHGQVRRLHRGPEKPVVHRTIERPPDDAEIGGTLLMPEGAAG